MTRRWLLASFLGIGTAALAFGAMALSPANGADCPGKVVCPLTGELVCKDRCPLGAPRAGDGVTTQKHGCCGNCCGDNDDVQ